VASTNIMSHSWRPHSRNAVSARWFCSRKRAIQTSTGLLCCVPLPWADTSQAGTDPSSPHMAQIRPGHCQNRCHRRTVPSPSGCRGCVLERPCGYRRRRPRSGSCRKLFAAARQTSAGAREALRCMSTSFPALGSPLKVDAAAAVIIAASDDSHCQHAAQVRARLMPVPGRRA
jgi:hypothetical protein